MKEFVNYVPTMFFFGRGSLKVNAETIFPRYGKRAYLITSRFIENRENVALRDAKEVLENLGIKYEVTEEVEENPSIRNVVEITKGVRAFDPDFLIGIGGGSALDAAKAVSVLLEHPSTCDNIKDATAVFYEGSLPHESIFSKGKLPVFAVPTTAGTGSEATAFAVLTNEETHAKLAISHPVFCVAGFLDSTYIEGAPELILYTGAMDALAHGVESYVNKKSNQMNRSIAEIGFRLFAEVKGHLIDGCLTSEDYDRLTMMSNIFGMAFMRSGTTIPHGMGYALSTFKGVNHGLSCSITLGEYLKIFKEQENIDHVNRAIEICGFENVDAFADYISVIIGRALDITVTEEEINEWSESFFNMKYRLTKHPETITGEDVHRIYMDSLKKYIK